MPWADQGLILLVLLNLADKIDVFLTMHVLYSSMG